MPLSTSERNVLLSAIRAYRFPAMLFDFQRKHPLCMPNMRMLERHIRAELKSGDVRRVKDGFSNVLFWGYGQMSVRDHRVRKFRRSVTTANLRQAGALFRRQRVPTLREIHALGLPAFSGMSFVSKILMFLDPRNNATLDLQLAKLSRVRPATILSRLNVSSTSIRLSAANECIYTLWCAKLRQISAQYFRSCFTAAEVERGFFHLVQCGQIADAARILRNA